MGHDHFSLGPSLVAASLADSEIYGDGAPDGPKAPGSMCCKSNIDQRNAWPDKGRFVAGIQRASEGFFRKRLKTYTTDADRCAES